MPETRVPMTLRDHFLQDPFFKSAWDDMETFRGSFFRDSQSTKMIESSEKKDEKLEEKHDAWRTARAQPTRLQALLCALL